MTPANGSRIPIPNSKVARRSKQPSTNSAHAAPKSVVLYVVPGDHDLEQATEDIRFFLSSLDGLSRAALERAVKLNPNSIAARMDLGAIYLEYLNYRDADKQYAAALKLEPENLEALTGRALTLEGKRQPKEAAELYEKVLGRDPERHALEVRLALIYNKAPFNDGNKSIVYWKRYLKSIGIDPEKRQDIVNQLKTELDATRAQLKTMAAPPKKAPADWAKQKAEVVKKEAEQTTRWKNVLGISSFIDAIEQGMALEKQAKEQGEKKPDAPAPNAPTPEAPK